MLRDAGDRRSGAGEADELLAPGAALELLGEDEMAHALIRPREDAEPALDETLRDRRRRRGHGEIDEGAVERAGGRHLGEGIALDHPDIFDAAALEAALGRDGESA